MQAIGNRNHSQRAGKGKRRRCDRDVSKEGGASEKLDTELLTTRLMWLTTTNGGLVLAMKRRRVPTERIAVKAIRSDLIKEDVLGTGITSENCVAWFSLLLMPLLMTQPSLQIFT